MAGLMTAYVEREPWPAITSAVDATNGHVYAAIGYIGADAHRLLPLGAKGLLVCDASPAAVSNGSTNPKALYKFLKAGVEVFSFPGLHAKVVVLPRRAFVGSANASKNSEKRLFEAVLETTDTNEIRKLREFVTGLCVNPINRSKIKELELLFETDRAAVPDVSNWGVLPTKANRLVVLGLTKKEGGWSKSELTAWEKGDKAAIAKARQRVKGILLDEAAVYDPIPEGEWVVQVVDGQAVSPGQVVHNNSHYNSHIVWLARPKKVAKRLLTKIEREREGIPHPDDSCVLKGSEAKRVVNLFR